MISPNWKTKYFEIEVKDKSRYIFEEIEEKYLENGITIFNQDLYEIVEGGFMGFRRDKLIENSQKPLGIMGTNESVKKVKEKIEKDLECKLNKIEFTN